MSATPIIRPIRDRVLVRRVEPAAMTPGGILTLEDAREPTYLADVVAVGPGSRLRDGSRRTPPVKPGDRVLLHMLAGARSGVRLVVESGGEECTFVHQADIQGVLAPGADLSVTLVRA